VRPGVQKEILKARRFEAIAEMQTATGQ